MRGEGRKVGGRARVGLDVDAPDLGVEVEGLEGALAGEVLEDVNVLVAAVVTGAGETLRVLVGEDRAVGLHDGKRGQVLRSNELKARELTPGLLLDDVVDLGVVDRDVLVEHLVEVIGDGDRRRHPDERAKCAGGGCGREERSAEGVVEGAEGGHLEDCKRGVTGGRKIEWKARSRIKSMALRRGQAPKWF
jgi:hypothetical protein